LDAVGCSFALLRRACWPALEDCYDLEEKRLKRSVFLLSSGSDSLEMCQCNKHASIQVEAWACSRANNSWNFVLCVVHHIGRHCCMFESHDADEETTAAATKCSKFS
jgi:hypothetical protein